MTVNVPSFFRVHARARLLMVAFLFVAANMVSTLGVFVPSASAALVWEDIVVADGPNGTTMTSGAVPKGSGLDLYTLSSADLSAYSSFKLSFDYENSNQSITSLDLFYWLYESHIAGDSIGSAFNFSPSESVSASSGHIEATFSGSVPSTNRLRLVIDDVNRNTSNDPSDRLDITNIQFQGQKDDGTVAAPAAPTLVSPDDAVDISLDDIYANTDGSYLKYNSADNVQLNHIQVTGEFDRGDGVGENKSIDKVSEAEDFALENFVPQDDGYSYIVGKTYTWKVRSSFSDETQLNAAEGWGAWSVERSFTVVEPDEAETPAAPTLVSPENGVLIDYADIHDSTAKIVFTPVDGVQTNHVEVSGLFKDSFGYEVLHTYNGTSAGELTFATAEGSFHDFIIGQTYTWRVRSSFANIPVNETNNPDWGAWSVLRSFKVVDGSSVPVFDVPTLISPDDNAATSNAAPTFTWGAVEGAGMYRLVVRPDALSSTFWECYTTSTSCSSLVPQNTTDTTLLPGRYYWYVEAHPSANPHADDPDGMHWVSSLDRAITITAGGDGNSGSGNTTTVSTGASPSPAGNTPAPNTPAPVDTTGEVLNEQDTAPSTAADEDQASERSNEATTSSDESNEDEDSKPFLLLGWWWIPLLLGIAGAVTYFRYQTTKDE